ncbi:FAD-binding protein [Nocardia sp. NPDC050435]|uniref:FAD-dependent oxidoreductase n=1 Tax=Nocardia sp. NPDC050435 TaxID=3155040 RepID=UPI0033DB3CEA
MPLSRRSFLTASAAGALATGSAVPPAAAAGPQVLRAGDPAYAELAGRGYNRRFAARPDRIFVPTDTEQVRAAVARSVGEGAAMAVRSGGHCFEDFVDDERTRAIIDLHRMTAVTWDREHNAFSVAAGADLGGVYEHLLAAGVTAPAGICKGVGVGGFVAGGGYGPLSRSLGLMADHLYGVEVVTVDRAGTASTVLATRGGPHADLWWAHTGGGGGNFGVVTRYLLRSPDASGDEPARALPAPPGAMLHTRLLLPPLGEESFGRFVGNYLAFFEQHSAPGDPFTELYAPLHIRPGLAGPSDILILLRADRPDTQALFDEFVAAVSQGVFPAPILLPATRASYADTVANVYYPKGMPGARVKAKTAYLRRAYSADQLRTLHRSLTDLRFLGESQVEFMPFGGAVNAVAADATAMPARDSFMTMLVHATWRLPGDDERYLTWARELFHDLHADSGGVPVPGGVYGGSYINYPDRDLTDYRWNTSGVPWHGFYYRGNYPRLQEIKARWDPNSLFRHRLSIDPG